MKTSQILTFVSGVAIATAADCAAPGAYDKQGRYSCNPAHQYPNGQTCPMIDGCPLLCDATGKPITSATTTAMPTGTTGPRTCVAPGAYDWKGRYSCNPAHQYPNGQTCIVVEGCPLLCDANGQTIINKNGTQPTPPPIITNGGSSLVAGSGVALIAVVFAALL